MQVGMRVGVNVGVAVTGSGALKVVGAEFGLLVANQSLFIRLSM